MNESHSDEKGKNTNRTFITFITSVPMDTIVIVNEFLQEGLVLFQDVIAHVWDVVKESLIFNLSQEPKEPSIKNKRNTQREAYKDQKFHRLHPTEKCKNVNNIFVWMLKNLVTLKLKNTTKLVWWWCCFPNGLDAYNRACRV